jgi:hypothetical protein
MFYKPSCTPRAASCRAARDDAARAIPLTTWRSYPPRSPSTESSSVFAHVPFFDPIFKGSFGGLLVLKMCHAAYRWKALDVYFPTIQSLRESELGRESYDSRKSGCRSCFCVFFRRRFRSNGGSHQRTESCTS